MVKIKDFTLASKNLGGGHVPPVPTRFPPMPPCQKDYARVRFTDFFQ